MEYQKVIYFLDNTPIQANNTNSQIKFKTSMLKPCLCDYSDTYILASGTVTVAELQPI